ncbi:hypothetical protein [Desulfosporosinus metallidurans]|uniref:Uncharacterized protein n=1 Tax=Desulfosporosinus metallidurans TaxID=1888891 RepID=A0A1Q8QNP3_9FIRM|nr:hypothetical protein [Desulfosporosinus metallidurans]OLN28959.1 hypothetical protein DSOL_3770 [Desulfosporosinus metallidurans]
MGILQAIWVLSILVILIDVVLWLIFKVKKNLNRAKLWKRLLFVRIGLSLSFFIVMLIVHNQANIQTDVLQKNASTLKAPVSQTSLPKSNEWKISDMKVGLPFSDVENKLPSDATIEVKLVKGVEAYVITSDQQKKQWTFSKEGMLRGISVSTAGSGLDGGLTVGDKEYHITDIMGAPTISPNNSQDKLYVYKFPDNEIQVRVNEGSVDRINLNIPDGYPVPSLKADEAQKILLYYNTKVADKFSNSPLNTKPKDTKDAVQKNSPSDKTKTVQPLNPTTKAPTKASSKTSYDRDKLVATAKIVNSYFIEYQNISLSNTPADKKSTLKALQEKADLWNLSITLEENIVVQSEDKLLWRWLVQFTDQVGSAIDYHLGYLTGTDPTFKALSLSEGQKALVNAVSLAAQYQEKFGDL